MAHWVDEPRFDNLWNKDKSELWLINNKLIEFLVIMR